MNLAHFAQQSVECNYCGRSAPLVTGRELYPHRPDLWEKLFFRCGPCDAHVGCHPPATARGGGIGDGSVPLGRLANAELRRVRSAAHAAFDPIWQRQGMSRRDAYLWLAQELGIEPQHCHIGMFDLERCRLAIAAARAAAVTGIPKPRVDSLPGRLTGPKKLAPCCGCAVLPWEDCMHTRSVQR